MQKSNWTKRVMVFIDWFNVFHSIKKYGKQFYWLNYKKLASRFLEEGEKIVGVKYFTAIFPNDIEGKKRHQAYINALYSIGIKTILWEFQIVHRKLVRKNKILNIIPTSLLNAINSLLKTHSPFTIEYETYEEKKTDVNMAINIQKDAYEDKYDKAIIISWDNDISPAIVSIKKTLPHKKFLVVFPFGWKGNSLRKICDKSVILQKADLSNALLTDPTNWISKPIEWK